MAANAGVSNINAIVDFPLLQTVDLSGNCISSTKPLSRLPFLHDLDISHNRLTRYLGRHESRETQQKPEIKNLHQATLILSSSKYVLFMLDFKLIVSRMSPTPGSKGVMT